MLTAALVICFILLMFLFYGWALVQGVRKIFHLPAEGKIRLSWYILAGMSALIWLAQVLSLVMPLGAGAFLLVLAGGIWAGIGYFKNQRVELPALKTVGPSGLVLLGLILLSVLENSTHTAVNPDTGIYHAQAIRWIESYSAVPGLGNLHSRFAYNSSWLALNALFSFAFLKVQSFHLVPAALTLAAAADGAQGALDWMRGKNTPANVLRAIFLPLIFFVLGSQISSPGTDLPVILSIWLILTAWLDSPQDREGANGVTRVILFLACFSLVTIKLSAAPMLFLAIWLVWPTLRKPALVLKFAALAAIILLPWIARNVILSGYLIYPFPAIDLFNPDWKVPGEAVRAEAMTIQAWGRDPGESVEGVLAKPFLSWLQLWFIEKTTNQKIILLGAAFSWVLLIGGLWLSRRMKTVSGVESRRMLAGFATVGLGAIYWLLSAPDIRFGYGYLLALIGIAVLPWVLLVRRFSSGIGNFIRIGAVLGLIAYQSFFLLRSFEPETLASRLILPADYPSLPSEPCALDGGQVWCASSEAWTQCWYAPFPCIPQPRDGVERRGPDWQDGFRPVSD